MKTVACCLFLCFLAVSFAEAKGPGNKKPAKKPVATKPTPAKPTPPPAPAADPAPAPAPAAQPPAPLVPSAASPGANGGVTVTSTGTKIKTYDFSAMGIQGKVLTPQLLYLLGRIKVELEKVALEKRSFVPELVRSVDEGGL